VSRLPGLYQWNDVVAKRLPHLSKPMATCLALWSLGMILAKSCSLSAVAWTWQAIVGEKFYTLRERLRDLYREAPAKAGTRRRQLELETCWTPWLNWVVDGWGGRQLALALDATTLGQRFTVLAISVLYRGCAVPVAWKILRATEAHSWEPEWKALLGQFRRVVPADWDVIVLADRGLYAKWLFEAITAVGWHPLLRINRQGKFRPEGWHHWTDLSGLVSAVGQRWQGRGTAFRNAPGRLPCTLLACWGQGYEEPWLVVTDLPPQAADACWYGLRAWIEQGFKRIKSGGWQWQYTRMDDPARAERLWLAVALATWWLLSVGGEADASVERQTLPEVPKTEGDRRPSWRLVAVFRRGWAQILAALLCHEPLPLGRGQPEPWPQTDTKMTATKDRKTLESTNLHL
jgi:Transposase DDE domain